LTGKTQSVLAYGAVYFFWGTTYLGIRYAIETIPPFFMGALRFALAALCYFLYLSAAGKWRTPTRRQAFHAVVAGVLMLAFGNGCVVWAEQEVPSGVTSLLIGTTPFWLVLFDWRIRGTGAPHWGHWAGALIGFAGIFLLAAPETLAGAGRVAPLNALALLGASVFWSLGSVYARKAQGPPDAVTAACLQMAGGAAAFLVLGLVRGEAQGFSPAQVSMSSWLAVLYLLVGGSLIGYTAWVYLLSHSTAARLSTITYVNPLVAVLLGGLVGGEDFPPRLWVAAPVILSAVFLMARRVDAKEEGSVA
jgi:drug/metabolite transporter (DMT)-like permease